MTFAVLAQEISQLKRTIAHLEGKIISLTTHTVSTTLHQQLTKAKTGAYITTESSYLPMSQSLPGVSPFPCPYSDASKRKNKYHCSQPLSIFPPSVKSPYGLSGFPYTPSRRLHRSKTLVHSRKSKHAAEDKELSLRLYEEQTRRLSCKHVEQPLAISDDMGCLCWQGQALFILFLVLSWPASTRPCEYYIEVSLSVFLVAISSEFGW